MNLPAVRSGDTDARKGRSVMALVRVKLQNGDEVTVGERAAKVYGCAVIDKPAVDGNGRPLPGKPNIHKGGTVKAASDKKDG